jgi:hypothetical protein
LFAANHLAFVPPCGTGAALEYGKRKQQIAPQGCACPSHAHRVFISVGDSTVLRKALIGDTLRCCQTATPECEQDYAAA